MNPEDEKYVAQLVERMKAQTDMMQPTKMPDRKPEMIYSAGNAINEQAVLSSVANSSPFTPAVGAFGECPQCGIMHPPLRMGEKCPVAKVEIKEAGITSDNVTKFTVDLRNIAISQIESKGIKDGNKLFKYLTIEFMKTLENYKE
jgi:hypothetical protein